MQSLCFLNFMISNLPALKIVFKVDLAVAQYQSPYQQLLLLPERRALIGSVSTYIVNHARAL